MQRVYQIISKLKEVYEKEIDEEPSIEEIKKFNEFCKERGLIGSEPFFCPEEWYYRDVQKLLNRDDVVLDAGAGDLRFSLIMSEFVKKVYAVEINPKILGYALKTVGFDMPENVVVIAGDVREIELPSDVTTIVCLMIHRTWPFPESWKDRRIIYTSREELTRIFVLDNDEISLPANQCLFSIG